MKSQQNELYTFVKYYSKMETIIMNTEGRTKNESNRFIDQFTDKLNLKNPNKDMALTNLSVHRRTLSLNTTTIN